MLIRQTDGELVLVTQWDHARLSGEFARRWGNDGFASPNPFESVCRAATDHDRGWEQPDSQPLYDPESRRPLQFMDVDWNQHLQFYKRGVRQVMKQDRYAGLLVSMHWLGLYQRRWGLQPELDIVPESERPRLDRISLAEQHHWTALIHNLWNPSQEPRHRFEDRLWRNYELLQFWDRLSILICLSDLSEHESTRFEWVPRNDESGYETITVQSRLDSTLVLEPYPFSEPDLEVSVPARHIPNREYEDPARLREVVQNTDREDRTVKITKPG